MSGPQIALIVALLLPQGQYSFTALQTEFSECNFQALHCVVQETL